MQKRNLPYYLGEGRPRGNKRPVELWRLRLQRHAERWLPPGAQLSGYRTHFTERTLRELQQLPLCNDDDLLDLAHKQELPTFATSTPMLPLTCNA